ncbi:HAD family hydrolase [Peribacillus asahii]|uniref:HAD family hydrolase n=1 Tax=Peribacillus asahii TaxID=228899 RepID=UPI00338DFEDA
MSHFDFDGTLYEDTDHFVYYSEQLKKQLPEDVHRILQNLDLQDIFENIITEANKPLDTKKHFLDLLQKFNIRPEKGLSIGDNYINDIAPAINIGMQTVYIDLYESEYLEYNGGKVKSISELIKEMNSL